MIFMIYQEKRLYGPELYCREAACGIDREGKVVFGIVDYEIKEKLDEDNYENRSRGRLWHNNHY